jgi:hypothetical protein
MNFLIGANSHDQEIETFNGDGTEPEIFRRGISPSDNGNHDALNFGRQYHLLRVGQTGL